jgi:hypothetical protein
MITEELITIKELNDFLNKLFNYTINLFLEVFICQFSEQLSHNFHLKKFEYIFISNYKG